MDEGDDKTSLLDSDGVFLAFFQLGRGNLNKGIPNFSLCALVNDRDGVILEVGICSFPLNNTRYSFERIFFQEKDRID